MAAPPSQIFPRKLPLQSRARATVDAVLEAAAQILEEEGLEAVNTNDVAARAGVAIGSLYQYFPSKDSILAELVRRERKTFLDNLCEAVEQSQGQKLDDAIKPILAASVRHQLGRPRLARALEYVEVTLPMDSETQALNDQITTKVAEFLDRHGIADAEQAGQDIAALARGMIDAAGLAGETSQEQLCQRVEKAVKGYLSG